MRAFLQLLSLIALLVAPLAAPASAMTPLQPMVADCKAMDMGSAQHQLPAGHHRAGEACCMAVPPAIDPPLAALHIAPPLDHPIFVAVTEAFPLGAGPKAEDPPPRTA